MKKIKLLVLSLILFNCNGQDKKNVNKSGTMKDTNIAKIENILKEQLNAGMSGLFEETTDGETYQYSSHDLDVIIPLQKEKLKLSGFKFLPNSEFNTKINQIFGRIIDPKSQSKYLYTSPLEKCEKNIFFNRNKYTASITPPSYYIVKNENFITDLYAIPEIIDYQKRYPNIYKLEDNINTNIVTDGNNVKLNLWKNADDLEKRRNFNEQLLVNRNKFLFNDNKASLVWLKFHDEFFLESLVKTFGYTKDKDLLAWVMKKNDDENKVKELINSSLFVRNCKGELEIRDGILKYIEENTTDDEKSQNYAQELASYDLENTDYSWTEKERYKIIAYIANTYDYMFQKTQNLGNTNRVRISYLGNIFFNSFRNDNEKKWKELEENFKINNYYNLPQLKSMMSYALEFEAGHFY